MKVAPLFHALSGVDWAKPVLVHTGQHHDRLMSDVFLRDLGLPLPDFNLGAGSGSHAETTAAVMVGYEKLCNVARPDWVVVVGDVNSTVAAALVAKKMLLPVAHLEAGLRSFDRSMPEEINRVVTDSISDVLWTPSDDADANLCREGIAEESIVRIGNVMIDAYEMLAPKISAAEAFVKYGFRPGEYGVVTLHRPANVDDRGALFRLIGEIADAGKKLPLIFPVHPRTAKRLENVGLGSGVRAVDPLPYIEFMSLVENAALVITDSGGIQEETSYLGVPCLTVRAQTERPITVTKGTNRLVAAGALCEAVSFVLGSHGPRPERPVIPLWDGRAALRAVDNLKKNVDA